MITNFILTDEKISNNENQLSFDFSSVPEEVEEKLIIPNADSQNITIPP